MAIKCAAQCWDLMKVRSDCQHGNTQSTFSPAAYDARDNKDINRDITKP